MSNKLDRFRFRVWDKADEEMSYPDYIYLGSEGMLKKIHINDNKNDNIPYSFECIEIMQCTGLKDKNGNLIFEGDIVKTENYLSVVKYEIYDDAEGYRDFKHLGFNTTYNHKIFDGSIKESNNTLPDINEICEVIGNIHENPELVK